MVISIIATWSKRLVTICVVCVILWHLTPHAAPRPGKAMVHVARTGGVVVRIDGQFFRVQSPTDTPVVCELAPGTHVAQVWRHGFLEGEEKFTVAPGRNVVIGPIDRPAFKAETAGAGPAPAPGEIGPDGLAARIRRPLATAVTN